MLYFDSPRGAPPPGEAIIPSPPGKGDREAVDEGNALWHPVRYIFCNTLDIILFLGTQQIFSRLQSLISHPNRFRNADLDASFPQGKLLSGA